MFYDRAGGRKEVKSRKSFDIKYRSLGYTHTANLIPHYRADIGSYVAVDRDPG